MASENGFDLLRGALRRAGEVVDGTSKYHETALRYMNNLYRDIVSGATVFDVDVGEPWPWARAQTPGTFTLVVPYETGTVSLTNGSASGTFSSAPGASLGSFVDRFLKVLGHNEYYRIISHTAGSASFTLDANYLGTTGTTLTFKCHKLIFDLGTNILRLVEPFRIYDFADYREDDPLIFGIELNRFRTEFPVARLQSGIPERFAVLYQSDSSFKVQVSRSVQINSIKVDFDYIPVPSDIIESTSSIPIIPRDKRVVLEYGTAHHIMMDKEDSRADYYLNLTKTTLRSMLESTHRSHQNTSKRRGQIVPRLDEVRRTRFIVQED